MAKTRKTKGPPLVAGSGQAWKVTAGIGALVVAAAASIFQFVAPDAMKTPAIAVVIASGVLGGLSILAVGCPSCRRSLGLWAFQTGSLTTWHERLVEAEECPFCSHRAG